MRILALIIGCWFLTSCGSGDARQTAVLAESTAPAAPVPEADNEPPVPPAPVKQPGLKEACLFSQMAYCTDPQAQLDQFLPGWKLVWHPARTTSNHSFIASDGRQYVVAIRGSLMEISWNAIDNWIYQDLNVVEQDDWTYSDVQGARIAQGTARGLANVLQSTDTATGQKLLEFLLQNRKNNEPVLFTGHSLGGNLAAVIASRFYTETKEAGQAVDVLNVISFASPAAGNSAFARDFDNKFPHALRVEAQGDIVAKFPCASRVAELGKLYGKQPSASQIKVGYKNMTVSLSTVFETMSSALSLLELKNGMSSFTQTCGKGMLIEMKPSGKNMLNDVQSWFAEAGYQHGVAQYATALHVPVVECK